MNYKHLSLTEKHYIKIEGKWGATMSEAAKKLNNSQCTISRELLGIPVGIGINKHTDSSQNDIR